MRRYWSPLGSSLKAAPCRRPTSRRGLEPTLPKSCPLLALTLRPVRRCWRPARLDAPTGATSLRLDRSLPTAPVPIPCHSVSSPAIVTDRHSSPSVGPDLEEQQRAGKPISRSQRNDGCGAHYGPSQGDRRRRASRPKPPSQCEPGLGFTQFRNSREASCPNDRTPDRIAAALEARLRPQVLGAAPRVSRRPLRSKDRPNTG